MITKDLSYLKTKLRIECQSLNSERSPVSLEEKKINGDKNEKKKFLEHMISQEQMSMGLTGVDNNLR